MTMTDRIVAAISMLALIAFVAVVVGFVRELDLAIVVILCLAIGVYDFWTSFRNGTGKA
jgi:hypothetical protein